MSGMNEHGLSLAVMEVPPEVWNRLLELSAAALAYSTQENQE